MADPKAMPHRFSWLRLAAGSVWFLALSVGSAPPAAAAPKAATARARASLGAERNLQRQLRQVPLEQAESPKADASANERPWSVSLGVSRESASTGHSVSTPFAVGWSSDPWYLEVSGDGYLDAAGDGTRHRGLADLALLLNYTYKLGDRYALTPEVELDLPSHGDVGSTRASHALRLTLSRGFKNWGWAAGMDVQRSGDAEPDLSRYTKTASLKLHYDFRPDTTTSLKFMRSLQAGAPASNMLGWSLKFPLPALADATGKRNKVWSATILLVRERSAGTSSHSIEFDIGCEF